MCAIADISWFLQDTQCDWTLYLKTQSLAEATLLTFIHTVSFLTKENISPLSYLSPFLPEQYVGGQERWQEEREGKTHPANSIYSHSSSVAGISSSNLSICQTPSPPYLCGRAKRRRLISACTASSRSYDAGSFQSGKQGALDLRCECLNVNDPLKSISGPIDSRAETSSLLTVSLGIAATTKNLSFLALHICNSQWFTT